MGKRNLNDYDPHPARSIRSDSRWGVGAWIRQPADGHFFGNDPQPAALLFMVTPIGASVCGVTANMAMKPVPFELWQLFFACASPKHLHA
jgi:hypothetical protein